MHTLYLLEILNLQVEREGGVVKRRVPFFFLKLLLDFLIVAVDSCVKKSD